MIEDKKLVQIFLSPTSPGVYEVSVDKGKNYHCTCPGYRGRGICKHTKFVDARVKQNNGTYPLEISTRVTQEDADKAQESNESFREFLLKFGKIEVC
jgi:uncharacterized Zn finger protein